MRSYQVGSRPENVIVTAGAIWTAVNTGVAVVRIHPSGEATRLPLGVNVIAVGAASDGAGPVWASVGPAQGCDGERSSVVRIDPESMAVTGRVVVPCSGFVTHIGEDLWVVDDQTATLYVATVEPP